jgi:hypothetical protein
MDYLRWFRHRLAHRLGSNFGRVVSATDDRGQVWRGFECALCGEINGAHVARLADGRRSSDPSTSRIKGTQIPGKKRPPPAGEAAEFGGNP